MRRAFTFIEWLVAIAIILMLSLCLNDSAGFQALAALGTGWLKYPIRLAEEREIDWPNTLLCVVCVFGFTFGVHFFGRWFAAHRQTTWSWKRTLKLVAILMLMFLAGIAAIGMTHEGVWLATTKEPLTGYSGQAVARTISVNHLKHLGLAAQSHHDENKRLPAGGTFDVHGAALHGWQVHLLPFIDQGALYKQVDLQLPWRSPQNAPAMKTRVEIFEHPLVEATATTDGFALSHYAGNSHILGMKPMAFKDITDGTSNTLLMGEVAHQFKPWGMPMNCRDPAVGFNTPAGFASPQNKIKVVIFLFADGTVRATNANTSPDTLKALATPRGGERVDPSVFD